MAAKSGGTSSGVPSGSNLGSFAESVVAFDLVVFVFFAPLESAAFKEGSSTVSSGSPSVVEVSTSVERVDLVSISLESDLAAFALPDFSSFFLLFVDSFFFLDLGILSNPLLFL